MTAMDEVMEMTVIVKGDDRTKDQVLVIPMEAVMTRLIVVMWIIFQVVMMEALRTELKGVDLIIKGTSVKQVLNRH